MQDDESEPAPAGGLDLDGLLHLMRWAQSGVVARRQVQELGGTDSDIARLVRRRELTAVHPGVYVDHTGPLTWQQRAWAAVLAHWPAALARQSALPRPPHHGPIHVAVGPRRSVKAVAGVVVRRCADFEERVNWRGSPPHIRPAHAVIDVVSAVADRAERYRVVAEACQTRETWPAQIVEALQSRRRVHDRAFLVDLLQDLAEGACSVLERAFLELERRHGLPVEGTRQRPTLIQGRRAYRDIDHSEFGLVIELDGRAFHDTPRARDRDAARDLETAIAEDLRTVRLTYGQVLSNGCLTIRKVSDLLERGGWRGPFKPCAACP